MTELDRSWAESQIEAMADDSLSAEAKKRMTAAMQRDPALAKRVEQARALRAALRGIQSPPVPKGLFLKLWRIPVNERQAYGGFWKPAGVLATVLIAVLGANLYWQTPEPAIDPEQAAAIQDFAIAVAYLQKSAVMARNEINETVGSTVLSALAASQGMIDQTSDRNAEGEQANVD